MSWTSYLGVSPLITLINVLIGTTPEVAEAAADAYDDAAEVADAAREAAEAAADAADVITADTEGAGVSIRGLEALPQTALIVAIGAVLTAVILAAGLVTLGVLI